MGHRCVFGPVVSRRFGRSLGVDVIPRKLCTLDCVYCEVGRTDRRGMRRGPWISEDAILGQLKETLRLHADIDHITFSGSGEPTLHSGLGRMIREVKRWDRAPVVVLTNGTLLWQEEVRRDLEDADIVSPSLDAVTESVFRAVDRPHPSLAIGQIIDGLATFRNGYRGKMWLEILFVLGINDSDAEVNALRAAIERIHPDKVHVNTVVRPPAESWARAVSADRLRKITQMLGPTAEIIAAPPVTEASVVPLPTDDELLATLERRAMQAEEIAAGYGVASDVMSQALLRLAARGAIEALSFDGRTYFAIAGTLMTAPISAKN